MFYDLIHISCLTSSKEASLKAVKLSQSKMRYPNLWGWPVHHDHAFSLILRLKRNSESETSTLDKNAFNVMGKVLTLGWQVRKRTAPCPHRVLTAEPFLLQGLVGTRTRLPPSHRQRILGSRPTIFSEKLKQLAFDASTIQSTSENNTDPQFHKGNTTTSPHNI